MEKQAKFDIRFELYDWATGLLDAMIFVVLLFAFVTCMFSVSGPSMMDTLQDGDKVFISNLFYTPKRGDIVMFSKPGLEVFENPDNANLFSQPPFVKRVIAVGGDEINVDYGTSTVYINGNAIDEPYIRESVMQVRGNTTFPLTIPEGCVFCMGDNRNQSSDSRDARVGIIDERYILGRLLFRIYPFGSIGEVE